MDLKFSEKRSAPAQRNSAKKLERALQASIARLAKLDALARYLKGRVGGDAVLRENLDLVTREIEAGERALAARAEELGLSGSRPPFAAHAPSGSRSPFAGSTALSKSLEAASLSRLIARLAAGVRECGKRLCALLRAARAIGDFTCARAAYATLRALEKELWLFRPAAGAAPSFAILGYATNG